MKYKIPYNGSFTNYQAFFGNGLKMEIRKARFSNPAIKGKWTQTGEGKYELKPYEPFSFSFINFQVQYKSEGPKDIVELSYKAKLGFKIMLTCFLAFALVAIIISISQSDENTFVLSLIGPTLGFFVIFGVWWVIFKAELNKIGKKIENKMRVQSLL